MSDLRGLNVRQMQLYGAVCLWYFCDYIEYLSPQIKELVKHLASIVTSSDLPRWEEKGSHLQIAGRGDPLPDEVINAVPENYRSDLSRLIEYCIEIGIADMYGADTAAPLEFLDKCISILRKNNITIPELVHVKNVNNHNGHWGEAVPEATMYEVLNRYEVFI